MVVSLCSKSFKLGFRSMWTKNQDVQVGFRKGRETRDQIANIHWIVEKAREFQKSIYFCFMEYANMLKTFCESQKKKKKNCGKILKRWEYQTTLPISWETCVNFKKQQWEPDMEKQTGSNEVWQCCILSPWLFNFCAEYSRTGFSWWFSG